MYMIVDTDESLIDDGEHNSEGTLCIKVNTIVTYFYYCRFNQ